MGKFWFMIASIHDLTCTWSDLNRAANASRSEGWRKELAGAAIHFVVQLAIDLAPGDAMRLRELERQMIEIVEDD
jgi:hypothetical protein